MSRAWQSPFLRETPWQSKPHKALFMGCAALLSLYLAYVLFLSQSDFFSGALETAVALLWFFVIAGLIFLFLLWACQRLARTPGMVFSEKSKRSPLFFGVCAGLSLFLLGVSFLASYPGGVSYDVYNQWTQAQTGLYNSWHPVFHTLLMGLGLRLVHAYPWVVALQILCFSLALAWLMETLRAFGANRALLLALEGLIVASPLVSHSMMYLWKDDAMTLGAVLLCACCVNLYATGGAWLKKPLHAVWMGLLLAFTTLVRHNGMFYTLPIIFCLLLCYRDQWKKALLAAGVMALGLGLVMGPLYGALDIVKPGNTLEESVGIPMTVLMDARLRNPEALDEETKGFLQGLAGEERFRETYRAGNYNSIKFAYPREMIAKTPPAKLLGMALRTALRDPRGAFESINAVTDLVWDVTGKNEGTESLRNSGDLPEYPAGNTRLNQLGKTLQTFVEAPFGLLPLGYVFQNIGVQLALLLVAGLWSLYRAGPRALLLCLPVLLYDLGTMLLLCSNDARFFQFSMVVALPSAVALLRLPLDTHKRAKEEAQ